jgi:hypothetical protein
MKFQSKIHTLSFLRASVNVASIVVFGVGLVVMLGWIMDIPILRSLLPGLPAMRFNAALCFLLMGSSLWFLQNEGAGPIQSGTGKVLAGFALVISLLTLGEYLFGWNLGIDELFIKDVYSPPNLFPGRMSPIAALVPPSAARVSSAGLNLAIFLRVRIRSCDYSNHELPVRFSASFATTKYVQCGTGAYFSNFPRHPGCAPYR